MLRKLIMIHRKLLKSWYQTLLEVSIIIWKLMKEFSWNKIMLELILTLISTLKTLQMIPTMRSFKMLREKTFSKMIRMFKTTLIRMFRRIQIRKFRELGRKEEG
jgi:hypothetical protein